MKKLIKFPLESLFTNYLGKQFTCRSWQRSSHSHSSLVQMSPASSLFPNNRMKLESIEQVGWSTSAGWMIFDLIESKKSKMIKIPEFRLQQQRLVFREQRRTNTSIKLRTRFTRQCLNRVLPNLGVYIYIYIASICVRIFTFKY